SRSMGVKDVPETRLGAARNWLHEQLLPLCPPGITRSFYGFNQSLEPLPKPDVVSPTGDGTALASALQHLLAVPGDQPLAGVILCSDGIDTASGDLLAA